MPCHTAHLIIRVLRIIPRHVVLRTRHRRQVPVDLDSLHAEEVLAHEADLPVDVGRVLGVVVLQREAVAVVHEALWEASASDLKNEGGKESEWMHPYLAIRNVVHEQAPKRIPRNHRILPLLIRLNNPKPALQ